MLAAVPGSMIAAPFTMVLLAAFRTEVGALQTAPILIAVVTAFLAMEGVGIPPRQPPPRARTELRLPGGGRTICAELVELHAGRGWRL